MPLPDDLLVEGEGRQVPRDQVGRRVLDGQGSSLALFRRRSTEIEIFKDFFPQSELVKPVLPQAAQPGIFFYFTSFTEMHLLDFYNDGREEKNEEEERSPAPGGI